MENQIGSFVLASLVSSYPNIELQDQVPILFNDRSVSFPSELKDLVLKRIQGSAIEDLQSEYIDIFDRGHTANPLNETEYDRQRLLAKGTQLSDIAGFYHAFGFQLDADAGTMNGLDHISVELEFYALLLMKQQYLHEQGKSEGVEIVLDARKKFLQEHLGRFTNAILQRPGVQESEFYLSLFTWIKELLAQECENLGIRVEQVCWFKDQELTEEEMNCGSVGVCNK